MPSGRPAGSKDSGLRKKRGAPSAKASQNQAQGITRAKSKKIRASGLRCRRCRKIAVATSSATSSSASSKNFRGAQIVVEQESPEAAEPLAAAAVPVAATEGAPGAESAG